MRYAFNIDSWAALARALSSVYLSEYLYKIFDNYFQNRVFIYDTKGSREYFRIMSGVEVPNEFGHRRLDYGWEGMDQEAGMGSPKN